MATKNYPYGINTTPTSSKKTSRADIFAPCTNAFSTGNTPQSARMDRFIPSRRGVDMDGAILALFHESPSCRSPADSSIMTPMQEEYQKRLADELKVKENSGTSRLLNFSNTKNDRTKDEGIDLQENSSSKLSSAIRSRRKPIRYIPTNSTKILDAPDIRDDYYLNLLDWGPNNVLAVALGSTVYLWNAATGDIQMLMECQGSDEYITSVSWASDAKHIAVGSSDGTVGLWDPATPRLLRTLFGHDSRVPCLAWNGNILSTGGRDNIILNHDIRERQHVIATLKGHTSEICGLKWSPSGSQLASGGNDNLLNVWNGTMPGRPTFRLDAHSAAVKALAWCPWQSNLLASGGGTADRSIKFWNTSNGNLLNSVDTNSQVCSLLWNTHEREILSSHGFSENQLCLWRYPTMVKTAEFTGHTSRVLHMSQSPDGMTVCSAAADETLRFWSCFSDNSTQAAKMKGNRDSKLRSIHIR